jgi:molybdopterin converting factor small subunit
MTLAARSAIRIHVLLFARYAEVLGTDALTLELPEAATVADLVSALRRAPGGDALPARPLCAVNLVQVGATAPLADGDEVAILPPLAGG